MREIKFRAWDNKLKRFGYVSLHPNTIHWPTHKWWEQNVVRDIDDKPSGISFEDLEGWQMFTGLHDKNGKEIWEGDIIKSRSEKLAVIEWGGLGFISQGVPTGGWEFSEVIGNIYETPELLKGNE